MFEFEIEGVEYRAAKLNAFQQLHVSRKLAGVLPVVLPALMVAGHSGVDDLKGALAAMQPAGEALAAMPEADVEYVCHTCMSVVARHQANSQGGIWSPIWSVSAKKFMFDDIGLEAMLQITFRVIQDSLGNFMRGLLAKAAATGPTSAE